VRGKIHFAPATHGTGVDEVSGLQKAGQEGVLVVQFAPEGFDFGCEKGGIHRAQAGEQGGVRETMTKGEIQKKSECSND
jgi:hypothetical protein